MSSLYGICGILKKKEVGDECPGVLFGRDIGKVLIKFTHGKLCIIPRLVEDIEGKKAEL